MLRVWPVLGNRAKGTSQKGTQKKGGQSAASEKRTFGDTRLFHHAIRANRRRQRVGAATSDQGGRRIDPGLAMEITV